MLPFNVLKDKSKLLFFKLKVRKPPPLKQQRVTRRRLSLGNEALTTYFKDTAVVFKQLDTIAAALQNNTKIIVPEGKAISLILNEQENLSKATIVPIPQPTQQKTNSKQMQRRANYLVRFSSISLFSFIASSNSFFCRCELKENTLKIGQHSASPR